ncbi:MAG: protein kinase [Corynebacteriales bacterium]|nr:protein kinase [Mycobacteriales bacterium]
MTTPREPHASGDEPTVPLRPGHAPPPAQGTPGPAPEGPTVLSPRGTAHPQPGSGLHPGGATRTVVVPPNSAPPAQAVNTAPVSAAPVSATPVSAAPTSSPVAEPTVPLKELDIRVTGGVMIPGLDGYSNVELIAHGSSAIVYRARQDRLKRQVAIKLLLVDDVMTTLANVEFELETLVRLSQQAHIVGIIDTGITDAGQPFIVMEYCEGGSYAQILKDHGPLPLEDVVEVGIKIGEALHAAHDVGIIHRDVKPHNILKSRFGPQLTDFGIAYADELSATTTFMKLTPHHASPETLLQQHQTGKSDLYSLASTMWNLLAGQPPFAGPGTNPEEFRRRVLTQPVPRVPRDDLPEWIQTELARAMAKRPAHRHLNALEFAETLRARMAAPNTVTPWAPPAEDGHPYVPISAAPSAPTFPTQEALGSTHPASAPPMNSSPPQAFNPVISSAVPAYSASPANFQVSAPPPQLPGPEHHRPNDPPPILVPVGQPIDDDEDDDDTPAWRKPVLTAAIIGVILGLVATIGVLLMRDKDSGDDTAGPDKTPTPTKTAIRSSEFKPTDVKVSLAGEVPTVSWKDNSGGKATFVVTVLKSGSGTQPTPLGSTEAKETSLTLVAYRVPSGENHCFTVIAVMNQGGEPQYSPSDQYCTTP